MAASDDSGTSMNVGSEEMGSDARGSSSAYFADINAIVVSSMRLLKPKIVPLARLYFLRLLRSLHSVWRNEWGSSPAYFADINATVVSSIRLLKPHSLSYQDETLTRRPDTFVSVASKLLDAGLWL